MLFAAIQDVFIAGDLLWYHIQASKKCCAPDIMVVFGRLKGYRGSYVQYYLYDPETNNLQSWTRANKSLVAIVKINGWTSPRLKIRFVLTTLEIYCPDGRLF